MDRNLAPFCLDRTAQGQARKSLWIETIESVTGKRSKWVRLVRACGSKRVPSADRQAVSVGQARKSLWIETTTPFENVAASIGQARKSLWIETINLS